MEQAEYDELKKLMGLNKNKPTHVLSGSHSYQMGSDVRIPYETFVAIIRAAGGRVTLDSHDLFESTKGKEELTQIQYKDPDRLVFELKDIK